MSEFFASVFGLIIGWLLAWLLLWTSVVKSCPEAVGTQCEYFGHQKICLIGESDK